jgi:hypothetical protein
LQYIILSLITGLISGISTAIVKQKLQHTQLLKETIISITRKPILGRVPWFAKYSDFLGKQNTLGHWHEGIISAIKLHSQVQNDKALVFASPDMSTSRKLVLVYDMAKTMANLNYTVALVDCHLKRPSVLDIDTSMQNSSGQVDPLYAAMSDEADQGGAVSIMVAESSRNGYLTHENPNFEGRPASQKDANLVLYSINSFVKHPYEFFNTSAFEHFIDNLKHQYDWVLIDAPFGHPSPEFPLIAKAADATVLLLKHDLTEPELKDATHLLEEWDIKLLGSVIREFNPQFDHS